MLRKSKRRAFTDVAPHPFNMSHIYASGNIAADMGKDLVEQLKS